MFLTMTQSNRKMKQNVFSLLQNFKDNLILGVQYGSTSYMWTLAFKLITVKVKNSVL